MSYLVYFFLAGIKNTLTASVAAQTFGEFLLRCVSLLCVSAYQGSGKSITAQPTCLFSPLHCSSPTRSTTALKSQDFIALTGADVSMRHLESGFLARCLLFGCCCSQVRSFYWLKTRHMERDVLISNLTQPAGIFHQSSCFITWCYVVKLFNLLGMTSYMTGSI